MPKLLFLTHSAGFQHGVVKRPEQETLALAEQVLIEAAGERWDVTATQDCDWLRREKLDEFDAVLLYTTGELPMEPEQRQDLIDWVADGGAYAGTHSASDTYYQFAPYLDMVGGAFDGHPWHQEVRLIAEGGDHPATRPLGDELVITDEIYQFRDFRRYPLRVLLSLDPESVEIEKGKREDGDYAVAWCKPYGQGRVFYTALGHRPEVWNDTRFQEHLLAGIEWALHGPDGSTPGPAEAVQLFGDGDLGAWKKRGSDEPGGWKSEQWKLDGYVMEGVPGAGDIVSREEFGDALYHVEFRVPESPPEASGQARGNSGVYVQGRYEVQVLDSFGIEQGVGDCAAIYGKHVPLRNACRPAGSWQSYDIEFRAPRFGADGAKRENARMSVWHNGILVHDDVEVDGTTTAGLPGDEAATGPLLLQDHGHAVRYRNVWVLRR